MADYRSIYSGAQIDAGVGFGVAMTETAADTSAAVNRVKQTPGSGAITANDLGAAPAYTYGTEDLAAGETALETGTLHFVYE